MPSLQQQIETARNCLALCKSAANEIWINRAPDPIYADTVADCLFMIAAHESDGFRARRQYGFSPTSMGGAFGLWQCEADGINRSIARIQSNEIAWRRCVSWLRQHGLEMPMRTDLVLQAIQQPSGDPLAAMIVRLFHFGVPDAIPGTLPAMAAYAKRYHNTVAGSATAQNYLDAFNRWHPLATGGGHV